MWVHCEAGYRASIAASMLDAVGRTIVAIDEAFANPEKVGLHVGAAGGGVTLFLAAVAGVLIGLSLGALGGGGSMLAVPVLVYALEQPPAQATTGSLVVVGVTSLAGAVTAHRAGNVLARSPHPAPMRSSSGSRPAASATPTSTRPTATGR